VRPDEPVVVAGGEDDFVSRGGVKLDAALDEFGIDVGGARCLDAGASTGGFTDCLLRRGAREVVAVDVGRGQLDWKLRTDERVDLRERTNVRYLSRSDVDPAVDVVVADLSFISLRTVAPALLAVARPDAEFVLLVKPQFEAGPERVGSGGIVRSAPTHRAVLLEVVRDLETEGLGTVALAVSPIRGARGNVEFLAHARAGAAAVGPPVVDAVVAAAHRDEPAEPAQS
jgi:23S rRNA (cytidine1920-2'-O)/16S rRNA (cytidine1409-2'-O)-methyltransferase